MSVPLYVPVLPARQHAAAAYRTLHPELRTRVAPLWTLHPHPGMLPKPLADRIDRDTRYVTAVQGHGSGWLDAPYVDREEAEVLATALPPEWWDCRNVRPVTGPGRPEAQQSLALAVARQSEAGLGVRVPLPGEWHDPAAADVAALLDRLPTHVPVHLFLDLATVLPDRTDAAKEALRALDALVVLTSWRTISILAGGFPPPDTDLWQGRVREEPRSDWDVWHEIHHGERPYLPRLGYGDYGTHPAAYVSVPVTGGAAPWGLLRYTTERSYHLVKIPFGKRHDTANRAAARLLTTLSDFRGRDASAGERWLCLRAEGEGTVGNHAVWDEKSQVQHMTYVARSISPAADR
ncbi:hypothetical protein GFH48_28500 [Streptomyces fagopyri]|uniref:T4 beta protein n=1 Tax=Streptomyces fagopyri TaxID=2662397 RepID=A0A5Q0LJJ9_9ACTN|nr:hypothetical protein [Streptomyces fagopyri]QFZ76677.1 hypothetical protein GFH48_28500 [Streptomyces fagopyri]